MNWKTAANISGYSPTKSKNRPRRARYKLSYAAPEQTAIICMKFEGDQRSVYDRIDRVARVANVSRQHVIFNALGDYFAAPLEAEQKFRKEITREYIRKHMFKNFEEKKE